MADIADSDSDVEFPVSRKRKFGVISVEEEEDESDEDHEDSDSEGEDEDDESDEEESGDDDDDDDDDVAVNDIGLTDDINNDQCSICLMEFSDQLLGIPNSCSHVFCSVCIQEWSKNINTCPVDRKVFYTIATRKTKDGPVIDQIEVQDRTQVKEDEYEDPRACEICGVGDREETMLLCDGCDRGFHLECLTPPLESVPEGEWFCSDCFIVNPSRDRSEEAQFDTSLFDDEISFGQHEVALRQAARSRASSSQPRHARTVATTRRRRRTRRRQTGSRQTRGRTPTPRGKSSTRAASSSRGASTSRTRTKRKSRRKKKKRRKKRKGRKSGEKRTTEANDKKKRRCGDVSPSRYLLPHEMEASSTFSLFGSAFDLEYLPVAEAPVRVTPPRSQEPTSGIASNPDVLGSIFTGLDTLHHKPLSMDSSSHLKLSKSEKVIPKDEKVTSNYQTVVPKNEKVIPKDDKIIPKDEKVIPKDDKVIPKDDKVIPKDDTKYERSESSSIVNEKRIKRFDTSFTGNKSSTLKTFSTIFGGSSATNTACEGANKDTLKSERVKNLKSPEHRRHKVSKYGESSPRMLKRSTSGYGLATYKIPRKKATVVSSSSDETSEAKTPSPKTVKKSKCKAPVTKAEASLGYSQSNTGILRLLPETPCEVRPVEKRLGASHNSSRQDSASSVADCSFPKNASYIAGASRESTSKPTPNVGSSLQHPTSLVIHPKSTTCSRDSTPVSAQDFTKITSHTPNVGHNYVSSVNISDLKKANVSSTKFENDGEASRNSAFKSNLCRQSSTAPAKTIPEGIKTASSGDLVQTATNLHLIEMLKQKKSTLYDSGSVDACTATFSEQFKKPSSVRFESTASTSRVPVLPPLRAAGMSARPVAVVRPTKQESTVTFGKLSDADAAKRRKEGIERLCREQKISDEVKEALKPYYRHKEISKDEYKYIYRRAAEKIRESSCPVEPRGVCAFVKNYVKKIKGDQKKMKANK